MSCRCWRGALAGALLLAVLAAGPGTAGELPRHGRSHGRAKWLGNPANFVPRPTPSHGFAVYNVPGPYYGKGFGVPTFNWGYFGARSRTSFDSHLNYYGTATDWTFSRGR